MKMNKPPISYFTRWRIYVDEDYLWARDIDLVPVVSPSYDDSILRVLKAARNKYVFYYLMLF